MKTQELNIEGMTCNHCVMSVKKELSKLSDVTIEDVQIGKAKISFDENKVTQQLLANAIAEAGYTLVIGY